MLQNYHSLEHFLSLLKFCFPVIVVSLAQINSQKFSTGSDVSYVDTLHGKVSFQPNFTKTLGYVFKEFPNSVYALQSRLCSKSRTALGNKNHGVYTLMKDGTTTFNLEER